MKGSARARKTANVSLFPFLAVLLCTMGSLIVVLVVIAQQARSEAERRESSQVEQLAAERAVVLAQAEEIEDRREELTSRRDRLGQQVEQLEAELANLVRQSRQFQQELDDLAAQTAQSPAADDESRKQELNRQADWYRSRIQQVEDELRQANQRRGNGKTYAVLPYRGRSGTSRRPIYVECRSDRVLLQPEGIELTAADFAPGRVMNPLSAALVATVDYYQRNDPTEKDKPYPMILVRPDGIESYYKVVESLQNWRTEFGYEFVEQDWELEFPPADKLLASMQVDAVQMARRQMLRELRTRPSLARGAPPSFSVSSSGGLRMVDPGDSRNAGGLPDRYGADSQGNARETTRGPGYPEQPLAGSGASGSGGAGILPGDGSRGAGQTPFDALASGNPAGSRYPTSHLPGEGGAGPRYPEYASGAAGLGDRPRAGGDHLLGAAGGRPGSRDGSMLGGSVPDGSLPGGGVAGTGASGSGTSFTQGGGSHAAGNRAASAAALPGNPANDSGFGWSRGGQPPRGVVNPYADLDLPGQGTPANGSVTAGSNSAGAESPAGQNRSDFPGLGNGSAPQPPSTRGGNVASPSAGPAATPPGSPDRLAGSPNQAGGGNAAGGMSSPSGSGADAGAGAAGSAASGAQSSTSGGPGGGSPGAATDSPENMPAPPLQFQRQSATSSIAQTAGSNWALPYSSQRSVPIWRSVRARVDDERLQLLSETGRVTQLVPLREATVASAYEIRNAVWHEMERWGMAGYGMHWQPSVQVEVLPGGEQRYRDLQVLFENSGFAIRQKGEAAPAPVVPLRR